MKIYAGYMDYIELEKYVGQDAWIWCVDHISHEPVYIRVLAQVSNGSFGSEPQYMVNILNSEEKSNLLIAAYELAMSYLTTSYTVRLSKYSINEPKRVLTTKQLYSDYTPDLTIFDKYIGKDVLVLAEQYGGYQYYVNPIRRDGNVLYSKNLAPEYIDGTWKLHGREYTNWIEIFETGKPWETPVDSWHLMQPVELINVNEVYAALEYNKVDDDEDEDMLQEGE